MGGAAENMEVRRRVGACPQDHAHCILCARLFLPSSSPFRESFATILLLFHSTRARWTRPRLWARQERCAPGDRERALTGPRRKRLLEHAADARAQGPCRGCVHLPQHWLLCEWCDVVRGDCGKSVACGGEDVLTQLRGLLQTEGRAVRVWWDGEKRWYEGVVLSYNSNHLLVDSHGDASHFFSLKRVSQTRITPR